MQEPCLLGEPEETPLVCKVTGYGAVHMGFSSVVEGPHGFLFSGGGSSWVSVQWWRVLMGFCSVVEDTFERITASV